MKSENSAPKFLPEQKPFGKRKIVIASVDIEDQARDMAAERLSADKSELKGVRGFFHKIWKHNLAHEYYRQKEIAKAKREIQKSGNLYAGEGGGKADHEQAMNAITERFAAEYDREFLRTGEEKRALKKDNPADEKMKKNLAALLKNYASGNLTDEQFLAEKNSFLRTEVGALTSEKKEKLAKKDSVFADNLLEIAKQMKQDVAHGRGMAALDEDFEVVVGRAKAGVETQAQYNAVDRILEKMQKNFVGRFVNEATLASVVALTYGALAKGTVGAAQTAAKWVGPLGLGLSAGIGGAVAGVRESKRLKDERAQHTREMAKGKVIESDSGRRAEMEWFRYETRPAAEMTQSLKTALTQLQTVPSREKAEELIQNINEIDSRISFSDAEKIDLISFSDAKQVEQERTQMYLAVAAAKVFLRKNIGQDWLDFCKDENELKTFLEQGKTEKIQTDFVGEKSDKDRLFARWKKRKVTLAVTKGIVAGVVVGAVAQEALAAIGGQTEGLFGGAPDAPAGSTRHLTALEYLRRHLAGELPPVDPGQLPQLALQHVAETEEMTQVATKDFAEKHADLFTQIKRNLWADNDSLRPDKNELKLWWGGDKGTGLDSAGNYVFNVKNMLPGGSIHAGADLNPQEYLAAGKMKLLVSLSQDTPNQVLEVPIDLNGNAIIDPNSEVGKLAFQNIDGHAKFIGRFAEVALQCENNNGVELVDILATYEGKGVEQIAEIVKVPAHDVEVLLPGRPPSDYDVEWPYGIPIVGRRPLERLGRQMTPDKTELPPPQVMPAGRKLEGGPAPEKKKETELKRVESFLYLLSAVELAALARKKGKATKEQQEKLASLFRALEKIKKPKIPAGVEPTKEQIEKMEKARAAAWHTIYKLANFEELNADTPTEGAQKFLDLTRKLWTEITVHEKPDRDANACLKLLELAGIKIDKVGFVKAGDLAESGITMDTSFRDGVIVEEDGKRLIIDHHGKESDRTTSAAKFVYETLVALGLLQKEEYLDKFVAFVTKCDNFNFTPKEMKQVYKNYPKNLYGLSYRMKTEDILELFKRGVDPMNDLPDDYLRSHEYLNPQNGGKYESLTKLVGHLKEEIRFGRENLRNVEIDGFVVDTGADRFGKILIDTKKKANKDKYYYRVDGDNNSNQLEVFNKGYGGYLVWSPAEKSFVLYTEKKMDDKLVPGGFSQGFTVRGHMWMKSQNDPEELTVTLEEIFSKLSGKNDYRIDGVFEKALNLDKKSKEMLDLLDDGKFSEDILRQTAKDSNIESQKLLLDMLSQRRRILEKYRAEIDNFLKKQTKKQSISSSDVERIAFRLLLNYQKNKAAKNQPPIAPTMPQQPPVATTPDVAAEKQKNMAESVKKLSGLFADLELTHDAMEKEAKKIGLDDISELAIQFINGSNELRVKYETNVGNEKDTKKLRGLAVMTIMESEQKKIDEKRDEMNQALEQRELEIKSETDPQKKQALEKDKQNIEGVLDELDKKSLGLLSSLINFIATNK